MSYLRMGLLAVIVSAVAGLAVWGFRQDERADRLSAENDRLTRSILALEAQAAQAAEAKRVAKANAERWERRAAEYQAALDDLTKGVTDAPLDPALRDRLNRLLTRP